MNINEKIEQLEKELAELKQEANKPKKWVPKNGERVYMAHADGKVYSVDWHNETPFFAYLKRGRYFKTRGEAEFFAEKELVRAELEALADDDKEWGGNNRHWCIRFEYDVVFLDYMVSGKTDIPYFKSKESAEKSIAAVGEDRIKKYLFGKGSNNED